MPATWRRCWCLGKPEGSAPHRRNLRRAFTETKGARIAAFPSRPMPRADDWRIQDEAMAVMTKESGGGRQPFRSAVRSSHRRDLPPLPAKPAAEPASRATALRGPLASWPRPAGRGIQEDSRAGARPASNGGPGTPRWGFKVSPPRRSRTQSWTLTGQMQRGTTCSTEGAESPAKAGSHRQLHLLPAASSSGLVRWRNWAVGCVGPPAAGAPVRQQIIRIVFAACQRRRRGSTSWLGRQFDYADWKADAVPGCRCQADQCQTAARIACGWCRPLGRFPAQQTMSFPAARGLERLAVSQAENLFLQIVGRRADDGYLLQTVFRLLDWGDSVFCPRWMA